MKRTFDTLPFCRRWLDREDGGSFAVNGMRGRQRKCIDTLNELVRKGVVEDYPPLCDIAGSYSSQLEHTLLVKWGRWRELMVGRTVRRSSRWAMIFEDFEGVCCK